MADIGWRRRRGSSPAARTGARQRAGLTPASASNTLSCRRETLHSQQLRSIKKSIDSDHGIYRYCEGRFKMKLPRRNFLHLAAGAAALPAVSRIAWAQAYPTRPVRLLVGWPPGGAADSDGSGPRRHVSAGAAAAEMPAQSVRA